MKLTLINAKLTFIERQYAKSEVNFGTHFLYKGEVNFAKVKLTLIGSQLNFDKKSS